MRPAISLKVFIIVLAGCAISAGAALWAHASVSPLAGWLVAAALSLAASGAAYAAVRASLGGAAKPMIAFANRLAAGDLDAKLDTAVPADLAELGQTLGAMGGRLNETMGFADGALNCLSESFPYLTLNTQGLVSHISPMLRSLLDVKQSEKEILGKTPGELFYRDPNRSTTSLEALKQNKKIERETILTTPGGEKRILRVSANPVHASDGRLIGSLTIYFDLTQLKANEQALADHARSIKMLVEQSLAISAEVTDASEKLAGLITEANGDAKKLLEHAGESATAMEEMNATVLEVARNSMGAANMAKDASTKAGGGAKTVESLVSRIAAVDSVIGDLKDRVRKLDSQADDIGKIIYVINDIADQTNLLALNAAIEAARAGEAGRGFAVVADEVRKLAEKTMSATGEVGSVISAIQDSVKSAASDMEDASKAIDDVTERANLSGGALSEILSISEQTSGQVQSIAAAAEQQSAAVGEISRTVERTNTIAGHTTDSMGKAAMSVLALSGRASDLRRVIEGITDDSGTKDLSLASGAKQKCWEFMKCGREQGGAKIAEFGVCPACPDHGEDCAMVEGTFCGGRVQGDFASKVAFCAQCDYFKSEHHERNLQTLPAAGKAAPTGRAAPVKAAPARKAFAPAAPRRALGK
jgi:methyl-accepting chemotaxis protein